MPKARTRDNALGGFACPSCQSCQLVVVDSRATARNTGRRRRHHCLTCKSRFTTVEFPVALVEQWHRDSLALGRMVGMLNHARELWLAREAEAAIE